MPECSNPTCLSLHWGKDESSSREVQYLHLLDHISAASTRSSVSMARWSSMARRSARLSRQTPQLFTETFIRLPAWRHRDRGRRVIHGQRPLCELDLQLLLNQGECDKPSHIAHQPPTAGLCWDSAGLCRYWPLTRSLFGRSGSHAEVLFKLRGLTLWRRRLGLFFATHVFVPRWLTEGCLCLRKRHGEADMFRLESSQACLHSRSEATKGCYRANTDRGNNADCKDQDVFIL